MSIRFAAIGLDHRHIYGMTQGMLDVGCECAGYWTEGEPQPLAGFVKRFPDVPRIDDLDALLGDPGIALVLIAAPPAERARLSLAAMAQGKDVMLDKPGCLTLQELVDIEAACARSGRIWSVNFSERFEVPSATLVDQLLAEGRIGKLVHIQSQGPHRLNAHMRPDWFWSPEDYGGSSAISAPIRSTSSSISPARKPPRSPARRSATSTPRSIRSFRISAK